LSFTIKSDSVKQTISIGKKLAPYLQAGDIISLSGDLGAGKTVFSKGIAKGLDVSETLVSPTFMIIREYDGRLPLYHFDVYRISKKELADLGYEDYFYSKGVTVIEWGDKIKDMLGADYLSITFEYGKHEFDRKLVFEGYGNWKKRVLELKKLF